MYWLIRRYMYHMLTRFYQNTEQVNVYLNAKSVHFCIQQVNRLYKQSDYISYNILRLSTYFGVGRVVQSFVFCVVFCVLYPGFLVWFVLPNL
jgi:hypothetical protein